MNISGVSAGQVLLNGMAVPGFPARIEDDETGSSGLWSVSVLSCSDITNGAKAKVVGYSNFLAGLLNPM